MMLALWLKTRCLPFPHLRAGNDLDVDGNPHVITVFVTSPAHGALPPQCHGSFISPGHTNNGWTPSPTKPLRYPQRAGGDLLPNHHHERERRPVAVNDAYTMAEGHLLTISAPRGLGNDFDVERHPLSHGVR